MAWNLSSPKPLISVKSLTVAFPAPGGEFTPVSNLSFSIEPGTTLGLVGESGCGKSMTASSLMRLIPTPGKITNGTIVFNETDILSLTESEIQKVRGQEISMIFQDPSTSFNPVFKIGDQIAEALRIHDKMLGHEAWEEAIRLLGIVGIPDPEKRATDYPHQMSGGMKQRAMIAMALACNPALLIADEPTTALDVTIQAQILDLLLELQQKNGMAILFISHDLAVVSEIADNILVMYAGKGVELAPADELLAGPRHPYTQALIRALPQLSDDQETLETIVGNLPDIKSLEPGCRFAPRCPLADEKCQQQEPLLEEKAKGHLVACFKVTQ
ncbi:MAG: ABC transporter ATP-binding protein [Alphaproteobacteria bacterium]|nr:ABC transporter ATP-binding protein [Alphaproteobacteria bacterium]